MSEVALKKHRILMKSSRIQCFFRATSDIHRLKLFDCDSTNI